MKGLVERLKSEPAIEKVYFNESGGWLMQPNVNHPIVKTRDEVFEEWEEMQQDLLTRIPETKEEEYELLVQECEMLKEKNKELEDANETFAASEEESEKTIKSLQLQIAELSKK